MDAIFGERLNSLFSTHHSFAADTGTTVCISRDGGCLID